MLTITMSEGLLGSSANWQPEPEKENKKQYEQAVAQITPFIAEELKLNAAGFWGSLEDSKRLKRAPFINSSIGSELPPRLNEAMMGLLFEGELERQGIVLPREIIDFMSRALSPNINERPDSFSWPKRTRMDDRVGKDLK